MIRLLRLCCLVVAAGACAQAAEEKWLRVTAGPFTVLTSAGESPARKWAHELERFNHGLQGIVPVQSEQLSPVTVVLFKNDREMESFAPLENGRPAKVGGLFVHTNEFNTIMVSLTRLGDETRHVVFHETVHWHLGPTGEQLPLWLSEGLADLYATFELTDGAREQIGAPLGGYAKLLRSGNLISLAQLIATNRGSVLYNEQARGNMFYAESWALTHLLLLADGSPGVAGLETYLAALRRGRGSAAAFTEAFGNMAALETRLKSYVPATVLRRTAGPRGVDAPVAVVVSDAPPVEVELAKGALLLGSRGPAAAERSLRLAAELAPGDARVWELLGIATATGLTGTTDAQTRDAAAAHFRRSLQLEPTRLPAYEGLAGVVYGAGTFEPGDGSLLARGLALAPGNAMIEAGVAGFEIRAGKIPEGRARLNRICALDPAGERAATKYARQILEDQQLNADFREIDDLARASRFTDAIAAADRALARGQTPANRQRLVELRRRTEDTKKINEAVQFVSAGKPAEAKPLLAALVANSSDSTIVEIARRMLADLSGGASPLKR